jgi:hypothetical protein
LASTKSGARASALDRLAPFAIGVPFSLTAFLVHRRENARVIVDLRAATERHTLVIPGLNPSRPLDATITLRRRDLLISVSLILIVNPSCQKICRKQPSWHSSSFSWPLPHLRKGAPAAVSAMTTSQFRARARRRDRSNPNVRSDPRTATEPAENSHNAAHAAVAEAEAATSMGHGPSSRLDAEGALRALS